MHAYTISNWEWSLDIQKNEIIHSPTIDSFLLQPSSKLFWGSSHNCCSLIWTSFVIKTRLDLKFAIDDWSSLHCQSTLITSKCHHLDRAMLRLAFSGSRHPFRASSIGIVVNVTFRNVSLQLSRFHSRLCTGNSYFSFRLDSAKRKETSPLIIFRLLLHESSFHMYWMRMTITILVKRLKYMQYYK